MSMAKMQQIVVSSGHAVIASIDAQVISSRFEKDHVSRSELTSFWNIGSMLLITLGLVIVRKGSFRVLRGTPVQTPSTFTMAA
jgi:hypothetical protein